MNASTNFPQHLHWTSHELADAVPLRLCELLDFDAHRDGAAATSANGEGSRARQRFANYARTPGPSEFFRIR